MICTTIKLILSVLMCLSHTVHFTLLFCRQKRDVLPNKRFLNNTLVSTLRHSFRQEQKHKTGSYHKYKEHIESQHKKRRSNFQTIREKQKEETSDLNKPEPDYGEFDAIAYADKCTDLYIRDSHRKHSRMKDQFVEKVHKSDSSESEESFTEYDDLTESKRPYDGYILLFIFPYLSMIL